MRPLKGYLLSEAADRDLEDIFDYTLNRFGTDQAVRYLIELETIFLKLTTHPGMGKNRNEIRRGLKSFPKFSHVIFYRLRENHIFIVRVLHGSRDVSRSFGDHD